MRLAASLALAAVCALLGCSRAYTALERAYTLLELSQALSALEAEIGYGGEVLSSAVKKCRTRRTAAFFNRFSALLEGGFSAGEAWEKADALLTLDGWTITSLRQFASSLGSSTAVWQCGVIKKHAMQLERCGEAALEQARAASKMRIGLGAAAGGVLLIMTL